MPLISPLTISATCGYWRTEQIPAGRVIQIQPGVWVVHPDDETAFVAEISRAGIRAERLVPLRPSSGAPVDPCDPASPTLDDLPMPGALLDR